MKVCDDRLPSPKLSFPAAESLWNAIDSNNRSLHTGFRALSQFAAANKESYENLIAKAVMSPAREVSDGILPNSDTHVQQ